MKIVLKSLIVWILLLAVPFQGFASATMLLCAPMPSPAPASAHAAPHDHHAMLTAQAASHGDQADHQAAGHHADGKCNSCANCCSGAAMAPSFTTRIPVETQGFAAAPFDSGFVPAVDLAFPERPPQSSLT